MADIHTPIRPFWCNEEDISEHENSPDDCRPNGKRGKGKQNDVSIETHVCIVVVICF